MENVKCKMQNECIHDIYDFSGGIIDLFILTHDHSDHINGFEEGSANFSRFQFRNVWFAWTEDASNPFENQLRKQVVKSKRAIHKTLIQFTKRGEDNHLRGHSRNLKKSIEGMADRKNFMDRLNWHNTIHSCAANREDGETMADLFRKWGIIRKNTMVGYMKP